MKRVLVAVLLAFATAGTCQPPAQPSGQQPKQIKDPNEYNAYKTAFDTSDPTAKGAAMEAFAKQYPQSVVVTDALFQAMDAYLQIGNPAKVEEIAKRILQLMPNEIRPMAVVVALDRAKATQGNQAALKEGCAYAQTGSQQLPGWQKPEGMNDADFGKLRNDSADIFSGAAGFCALQAKNYAAARDALTKAFQLNPTNVEDVYQLAVADLLMNPMDVNGFWYCGKAINLAGNNPQAVKVMIAYCKATYKRYHGGEDGWEQIVADTATPNALPAAFTVKPALTPAELAVQVVQQNAPDTLSFSDREFILSYRDASPANKDAADKVWASIQSMQHNGEARLEIPVKVISATKDTIDAAISDDNQAANKADLHVIMGKPMLHPPDVNSTTRIQGFLTSYTPQPFMFTMEKGELPSPKTPPRRPPVHRKKK